MKNAVSFIFAALLSAVGLSACGGIIETYPQHIRLMPIDGIVDEHEPEQKVLLKCRKAAIIGVAVNSQVVGKDEKNSHNEWISSSSTEIKREDVNKEQRLAVFRLCLEEHGYEGATFIKGYKPIPFSEVRQFANYEYEQLMKGTSRHEYEWGSFLHEKLKTWPCADNVAVCPGDGKPVQ